TLRPTSSRSACGSTGFTPHGVPAVTASYHASILACPFSRDARWRAGEHDDTRTRLLRRRGAATSHVARVPPARRRADGAECRPRTAASERLPDGRRRRRARGSREAGDGPGPPADG